MLHAHGPKNVLDLAPSAPGDPPYVAVPYLSRMDLAYAAADLAICRSGAMTVAEVTAVGLPAAEPADVTSTEASGLGDIGSIVGAALREYSGKNGQ